MPIFLIKKLKNKKNNLGKIFSMQLLENVTKYQYMSTFSY